MADKLKKTRTALRTSFTKQYNALQKALDEENIDNEEVLVTFQLFESKMTELDSIQSQIFDVMLDCVDIKQVDIEQDTDTADEYKSKDLRMKLRVEKLTTTQIVPRIMPPTPQNENTSKLDYELPKIEMPKFNGNVRDWLQFWSRFKKIHEDSNIDNDDKLQFLIQAIVVYSRAWEFVNSFPHTGENYANIIKGLKDRYGREDLLVEVYVRELLGLVLQNVMKSKEKTSLTTLYDKLESQMRALETLGVTTEKCAAMLFPLVESSLPEELLRVWQRNTEASLKDNADSKDRLSALMKFLKAEVQNEE